MMSAMKAVTTAGIAWIGMLGAALAADVTPGPFDAPPAFPARATPPVVAPGPFDAPPAYAVAKVYDWTGFYVGINGGGVFGDTSWYSTFEPTGGSANLASGLVGGTAGYNLQTGEPYVLGVEADIDWAGLKATVSSPLAVICVPGCEFKVPWLATVRLRFGYAFNRILPYITGGAVIADLKADVVGNPFGTGTEISTNLGWTVGAGIEYAFTDALRAKIEYLHIDLNGFNCNAACAGNPVSFNLSGNVIRAGLNYRLWVQ
jgi:outer membrane immunogenic protein